MKRDELTLLLWKERKEDKNKRIAISYEWFLGEDLSGLDLCNVNFDRCIFLGSSFNNCNFENIKFSRCVITGCDLTGVLLRLDSFDQCAHDINQPAERSRKLVRTITDAFYDTAINLEREKIRQEQLSQSEEQIVDENIEGTVFKMEI